MSALSAAMSEPLELTLEECLRLKTKLEKAEREEMVADVQDILSETLRARITSIQARTCTPPPKETPSRAWSVLNGLSVMGGWARPCGVSWYLASVGRSFCTQHLKKSGINLTIKNLSKHSDSMVAETALQIMDAWRAAVSKDKGKGTPPAEKVEARSEQVKVEGASDLKKQRIGDTISDNEQKPAKVAADNVGSASKSSSGTSLSRPVKRTGDSVRDSVREKFKEAFEKGVADNECYLREQDTDTALMAEEAETHMWEKFGGTTKEYKARFRSLVFNLRDPKNPEFIRQVVTGQRHVNDLAEMDVKEMASDEVKKQRIQWQENAKMALMDEKSYQNYAGKTQEDGILKCPKCKSMKTEYVEVQTRSADEPTTKKCLCNSCDYRWKFC